MVLKLEDILRLNQEQLLEFCYNKLQERGYKQEDFIIGDYIYAKGEIPILLVAHCDIVHKQVPQTIVYDRKQRIFWSPTGIGGDDRCGVYAILKICEQFKPYVLFTTDEEIGGVGVRKFTKEIEKIPVNFIIEFDRRGNKQVVYYQCENKEFQEYIESFGFEKQFGSYSDVSTLSTHYDIAGCNVSAGYYNEHTTTEHIYFDHLWNSINKVKNILRDTEHHKFYDCQEKKYEPIKYYNRSFYDWDNYYDDDYFDDDGYYWDYKLNCYRKKKNKDENKKEDKTDELALNEILQKEEDYYLLTNKQWKKKYKKNKPKDILEIY